MKLKQLSSMKVMTTNEELAVFKLVQRASEVMMTTWINDCMTAFQWDREYAEKICHTWRRASIHGLASKDETDKLEL